MEIFWRLLLGHFLADFTLQTNLINDWKRRSLGGMLIHCGMHPVIYALLTFPYLGEVWLSVGSLRLNGWACVLLIFVLHFIEDEWRIFSIFRHKSPDNTLFFLWDQLYHWACIFLFLPLGLEMSRGWFPEEWSVLAILFVLVTHFATILIYFIEKDLYGLSFPEFDEKYLGMASRLALALCFLLPGSFFAWLAVAWMALLCYLKARRVYEPSWLSLGLGGALAVFCGTAARLVHYGRWAA